MAANLMPLTGIVSDTISLRNPEDFFDGFDKHFPEADFFAT